MNNNVAIFQNEQFGQIRTVYEMGKVFFCGKDVATALGYAVPRKAITEHCKENGVLKRNLIDNMGRTQNDKQDKGSNSKLDPLSKYF